MMRNSKFNIDNMLALNWFGQNQQASGVLLTAKNLIAAEQVVRKFLPSAMAQACKVAEISQQKITLAVPSSAYASKLRQQGPSIQKELNQAGWNIEQVVIRIQAGSIMPMAKPDKAYIEPLGEQALNAFSQLHAQTEGPLAQAIERLLKRHKA